MEVAFILLRRYATPENAVLALGVTSGLVAISAYSHMRHNNDSREITVGNIKRKGKRRGAYKSPRQLASDLTSIFRKDPVVDANQDHVEPVHREVIALVREVVQSSARIVCVIPPVKQIGTYVVRQAFGFGDFGNEDFDHDFSVRYMDFSDDILTMDVPEQLDQENSGFFRSFSATLVNLIAEIADVILGSLGGGSLPKSTPNPKFPPLEDELKILSNFYHVLESTTRSIPNNCTIIIDGSENLRQLAATSVGLKAIAIFFNHMATLAGNTAAEISVCIVASGSFAHDFLVPLVAVSEQVETFSFGDLERGLARRFFVQSLRKMADAAVAVGKAGGDPQTLLPGIGEACFDEAVYPVFGGRAMDLLACANYLVRHAKIEQQLQAVVGGNSAELQRQQQRRIFSTLVAEFPDVSHSVRWLESQLDPTASSASFEGMGLLPLRLENLEDARWTRREAVAVFACLAESSAGFVSFDNAVDVVAKIRIDRSQALGVVRSLISRRVVAYRPASHLYHDGIGSTEFDSITVLRPIHLHAFKILQERLA
ncbi:hypothetical protein HK100_002904, partial [Physocladia obscura]